MLNLFKKSLATAIFVTFFSQAWALPKADIHLHYKWNQAEATTVEQALRVLDQQEIELAGVIGTPPELALELSRKAPERIFSWYGVYKQPGDWSRWANRLGVVDEARAALKSGGYAGVGELHLVGGFVPKWDTPVISGLLELSSETRAPLLLHVEFSRADYLIGLCKHKPNARLLLAHAGAPMRVQEVRRALDACPNLWWELSARDPFRYVDSPILTADRTLEPQWRQLILDYSDRLMLGSDPVWPVEQLNPWDEPDTGWEHIGDFWDAHEVWLKQLPEATADAVRIGNAKRFFKGSVTEK